MTSLNVIWISVHMHVYTYQKDKPHTHAASHPIVCMKGGNKKKNKKTKKTIYNEEINGHTSAETATASNQWSQFRDRIKGLNRVSKFDTTPNFTPAFLRALNTFSASGSQRCQAYGKKNWRKNYNHISLKLKACNL